MNMACQFLGTKSVAVHASRESFMHATETTVVNYFIAVKLCLTLKDRKVEQERHTHRVSERGGEMGRERERESAHPQTGPSNIFTRHTRFIPTSLSLPLTFLGVIVLKRLRPLTYITLAPLRCRHHRGSLPLV